MATTLAQAAVNTIIKLNENNSPVNFVIIQKGSPSADYVGFENSVTVLRQDIHSKGAYDSTNNDYANSDIYTWANGEYLNTLDEDIRNVIKTVKIPYRPGTNGTAVSSGDNGLQCKVFFLSTKEVDSIEVSSPNEGTTFSYFSGGNDRKRIAQYNGQADTQWTRSPVTGGTTNAYKVNSSGSVSYGVEGVYGSNGRRPAFVLPDTLILQDDGTVITNQPPTAPGSISVSGVVSAQNTTITITAATDSDGSVVNYQYERSIDGGQWNVFATANELSQTDTVSADWGTVAYRVCAIDDKGATGAYVTSDTYTVNSGWIIISGPDEELGEMPTPFTLNLIVNSSDSTTISDIQVIASLDNEEIYNSTINSGTEVMLPVDTRLMSAKTHTLNVSATKSDYLPAEKSYSFIIPAITSPTGAGIGLQLQDNQGRAVLPYTLGRLVIGKDGKDFNTLIEEIANGIQIASGTYVGTGTYGTEHPNQIPLEFEPQLVLISKDQSTMAWYCGDAVTGARVFTKSANALSWYSGNNAADQLNENGVTYSYFAIGSKE